MQWSLRFRASLFRAASLMFLLASLGCNSKYCATTIEESDRTLPAWEKCRDKVEYFEPGPEFKLVGEAAAMKAAADKTAAEELKSNSANSAAAADGEM